MFHVKHSIIFHLIFSFIFQPFHHSVPFLIFILSLLFSLFPLFRSRFILRIFSIIQYSLRICKTPVEENGFCSYYPFPLQAFFSVLIPKYARTFSVFFFIFSDLLSSAIRSVPAESTTLLPQI